MYVSDCSGFGLAKTSCIFIHKKKIRLNSVVNKQLHFLDVLIIFSASSFPNADVMHGRHTHPNNYILANPVSPVQVPTALEKIPLPMHIFPSV